MASSPRWKVYTTSGEYIASCKYPEHAAALLASLGAGTIRWGHALIVWTEGQDGVANESYDVVAEKCWQKVRSSRSSQT